LKKILEGACRLKKILGGFQFEENLGGTSRLKKILRDFQVEENLWGLPG
jgi:hypothetical protein